MDPKLIIQDEEYVNYADNTVARAAHVEETLQTMLTIMQEVVAEDGALEGETAENFATFIETVKNLQGKMEYTAGEYKKLTNELVAKIDECDQDIY